MNYHKDIKALIEPFHVIAVCQLPENEKEQWDVCKYKYNMSYFVA